MKNIFYVLYLQIFKTQRCSFKNLSLGFILKNILKISQILASYKKERV